MDEIKNISYVLGRQKGADTILQRRTGWRALASEIVYQAIKDYKARYTSYTELKRIREFFLSKRFGSLCTLDPEYVLYRLDQYRREHGYIVIGSDGHRSIGGNNTHRAGTVGAVRSKKG